MITGLVKQSQTRIKWEVLKVSKLEIDGVQQGKAPLQAKGAQELKHYEVNFKVCSLQEIHVVFTPTLQ